LGGEIRGAGARGVVRDHRLDDVAAGVEGVLGGVVVLVGDLLDQPVPVVERCGGVVLRVGGDGGPVVEVVVLLGEVVERVGDAGAVPGVVVAVDGGRVTGRVGHRFELVDGVVAVGGGVGPGGRPGSVAVRLGDRLQVAG